MLGLGGLALTGLLAESAPAANTASPSPLDPRKPHFPAKAKNVIFVHLSGAPPHLDMFDYKPEKEAAVIDEIRNAPAGR